MKLKNYKQFINEAISEDITKKVSDKFKDIKLDLLEMIIKSINNSETLDLIVSFLTDYTKIDSKSNIDGLVNDSDIYDFYIKYSNDIDEIVEKSGDLSKSPKDIESFSLYDYVVKQTKQAIKELANDLLSDLNSEGDTNQNEALMFWNKKDKQIGKIVIIQDKITEQHYFVYQLLDPKDGKAVLIGDIKMSRAVKFELWLNLEKKLGNKVIKKHFIFETIKDWQEPTQEQKKIIDSVLTKVEKHFDDYIEVSQKIKKITGVTVVL